MNGRNLIGWSVQSGFRRLAKNKVNMCCVLWAIMTPIIAFSQFIRPTEQRTEAAVVAVDEAWERAEQAGDLAYLNDLLLPEYRSVNIDGSTIDKAAILSSAQENGGSTGRAAIVAKWHSKHPARVTVEVVGDLALLTFILSKQDVPERVMSCDIFVYRGGTWHALYSQHTQASA